MAGEILPPPGDEGRSLGHVTRDAAGLAKALDLLKIEARFNERAHRVEWLEESPPVKKFGARFAEPTWEPTTDRVEDWIRHQIQKALHYGSEEHPPVVRSGHVGAGAELACSDAQLRSVRELAALATGEVDR